MNIKKFLKVYSDLFLFTLLLDNTDRATPAIVFTVLNHTTVYLCYNYINLAS